MFMPSAQSNMAVLSELFRHNKVCHANNGTCHLWGAEETGNRGKGACWHVGIFSEGLFRRPKV